MLGLFFFYILPIRKKVVLQNLAIAFPERDAKQLYKLARKCYISFAHTFLDIFYISQLSKNELADFVKCDELKMFKEKFNEGKGLIFLTGHIGNWEAGANSVAVQLGEPMYVLAKKQSNHYVTEWIKGIREKFGNKEIYLGTSVKDLFKALLNKSIIGVVGDQRGPKEGMRVMFFNRPTAIYPGTAQLALRTNSPIIVVLIVRDKNNQYQTVVEEIDYSKFEGSNEEKIHAINQKYFNILENTIRQYPEQWFWMHNIWKY